MTVEVRLIDVNAFHEKIMKDYDNDLSRNENIAQFLLRIETAPTIEAEPVRHGWWINAHEASGGDFKKCSECSCYIEETYFANDYNVRYCPNCGAKMDGADDHGGGVENATD